MEKSLLDYKLLAYMEKAQDNTSLPGGGSICALSGSLAVSLGIMVVGLSEKEIGQKEQLDYKRNFKKAFSILKDNVDRDARAFDQVLKAMRLGKDGEKEKKLRQKKIQEAYIHAIEVPLSTMEVSLEVLRKLQSLAGEANVYALSDVAIGADLALSAIKGASFTVEINIKYLQDQGKKKWYGKRVKEIKQEGHAIVEKIGELLTVRSG